MITLFRYLFLSGLLVALAWGFFGIKVGERTMFGHFRAFERGRVENIIASFRDDLEKRIRNYGEQKESLKTPAKKSGKKPAEKRSENTVPNDEAKISKLQRASSVASPNAKTAAQNGVPTKTKIDEKVDRRRLAQLLEKD